MERDLNPFRAWGKKGPRLGPFTFQAQNQDPDPVFKGSEPPNNGRIGDRFTLLIRDVLALFDRDCNFIIIMGTLLVQSVSCA